MGQVHHHSATNAEVHARINQIRTAPTVELLSQAVSDFLNLDRDLVHREDWRNAAYEIRGSANRILYHIRPDGSAIMSQPKAIEGVVHPATSMKLKHHYYALADSLIYQASSIWGKIWIPFLYGIIGTTVLAVVVLNLPPNLITVWLMFWSIVSGNIFPIIGGVVLTITLISLGITSIMHRSRLRHHQRLDQKLPPEGGGVHRDVSEQEMDVQDHFEPYVDDEYTIDREVDLQMTMSSTMIVWLLIQSL